MRSNAATHDDEVALSRPDDSVALADLNAALDKTGLSDKQLFPDGMDKRTVSKMRTGQQAFPVALLDVLPREARITFYRRQLAREGYEARPIDPTEVTDEILAAIEQLGRLGKLARLGRARPAKARE